MDHYLRQFNEETIVPKQQHTCGEPCPAVCKKMRDEFKKDYEPYQTMGPLCGIFDQRAAERLNHHADALRLRRHLRRRRAGLADGVPRPASRSTPAELGVEEPAASSRPRVPRRDRLGAQRRAGRGAAGRHHREARLLNLGEGAASSPGASPATRARQVLDPFVYMAFARKGWMVPNQYWTPGALSPMAIMGKYYMYYGNDFMPPRTLGRINAERFRAELIMDNLGVCRFHRLWAEEMLPEVMASLYGKKEQYLEPAHHHRQPDQQPQLVGLLGVGAERRLRARVPQAAARRRG